MGESEWIKFNISNSRKQLLPLFYSHFFHERKHSSHNNDQKICYFSLSELTVFFIGQQTPYQRSFFWTNWYGHGHFPDRFTDYTVQKIFLCTLSQQQEQSIISHWKNSADLSVKKREDYREMFFSHSHNTRIWGYPMKLYVGRIRTAPR